MFLSRLHRRITAWVALLTLVLGALAPTVAQALVAGSDRADWLQVCSVSGMVWVQADTGEVRDQRPDGGGPMADASQHCPWCTLHGGAAGLPVAQALPELPPRLTDLPPAFYRAPLAATVWVTAQSRAPPLAA
ncbi:MAG: DUF2946 domain-containing protein [Hydrogenophaga sp.]|uniref:DUF2946 domain-containing protein n=1 Tax=Hydrogenophaga sp. TaxID=1904254 RepID=UPI003D9BADF6